MNQDWRSCVETIAICNESGIRYDGFDINTSVEKTCSECFCDYKTPLAEAHLDTPNLKRCSGCKVVYYCSSVCQKEAWSDHKEICKEISALRARLAVLEADLRREGYFAADADHAVGNFWSLFDPREYCRCRHHLAESIHQVAWEIENAFQLQQVLDHQLELLRLSHSDSQGIRHEVPFVLLSLNEYDRCYAFVKWWATVDPHGTYDWGNPPPSEEGGWLYLTGQDRSEDLFEVVPSEALNIELSHLAALALIKFAMIAHQQQKLYDISHGKVVSNAAGAVETADSVRTFQDTQLAHAGKVLAKIHRANRHLLPALSNPTPLRQHPDQDYYTRGDPYEALNVLNRCCRHFARIPGANRYILDFLDREASQASSQ